MLSSLQSLMDQRQLWRARESGDAGAQALATGWPRLDRDLYGAGWPMASLTELLGAEPVLAWQLLQPALVQLSQQQRLLVWIGHQQPPYAPAWLSAGLQLTRCLLVRAGEDEAPWAAEQALRLAQGGAVILQAGKLNPDRLRRLQLAAQAGNSFGFLLRPLVAQRHTSPAVLRLTVQAADSGLQVTLLKRRGGTETAPFVVPTAVVKPTLSTVVLLASPRRQAGSASAVADSVSSAPVAVPAASVPVVSVSAVSVPVDSAPTGTVTELSAVAVQATAGNGFAPVAQQWESRSSVSRSSVGRSSVTLPPRMAAPFLTEPLLTEPRLHDRLHSNAPSQDPSAAMAADRCHGLNLASTSPKNTCSENSNPENTRSENASPVSTSPKTGNPSNTARTRTVSGSRESAAKPAATRAVLPRPDKHKAEQGNSARQTVLLLQLDFTQSNRAPINGAATCTAASAEKIASLARDTSLIRDSALIRDAALSRETASDKTAVIPDGGDNAVEHSR